MNDFDEIILVYNASSSIERKLIDNLHKIISPSTYSCNLCILTHGNFGEHLSWRQFRDQSKISIKFFYKEDIKKITNKTFQLPVILAKKKGAGLKELIGSSEIKKMRSTNELISQIEERIY